jgi:hypothetical protein
MKPMVNISGICPANLASWNGAEVSVRITFSETSIHIQIERPPPVDSSVEHLRQEFAKIESHFSGQSLKIIRHLLATCNGQANRSQLMKAVLKKTTATFGAVRQAILRLNIELADHDFGYTVRGNLKGSKGIYRLVPVEK